MAAGLLMMASGAFSESGGQRVRGLARNLMLLAVAMPLAAVFLASLPRALVIGVLLISAIIAFLLLETRHRDAQRARPGNFVNYRASGKVPLHEDHLDAGASPLEERDDEIS